jgi:hypothetical protein
MAEYQSLDDVLAPLAAFWSVRRAEGGHMTLMRGRFIGYEYDRMVVLFSTARGRALEQEAAHEIRCSISAP